MIIYYMYACFLLLYVFVSRAARTLSETVWMV